MRPFGEFTNKEYSIRVLAAKNLVGLILELFCKNIINIRNCIYLYPYFLKRSILISKQRKSLANIKSTLDRFFESKKQDNNKLQKNT